MKTQQILNRLLINRLKKNPVQSDQGFTLIELLVVVLMIGIISAIAAPSWQAFTTGQRIKTVNNQVFQAIKVAQAEAKRKKGDVTVTFNDPVDPPTISYNGNEQKLNVSGEIKAGTIKLVTGAGDTTVTADREIVFDYQGSIKKMTPEQKLPFIATVSLPDGTGKRCTIVQTLLGGMRTAEKTDCPTPP
ncbi:Fimbrial protein [Planktothrix rubescens]|nr:Fimbrial protein [Planktothrix rubescens]